MTILDDYIFLKTILIQIDTNMFAKRLGHSNKTSLICNQLIAQGYCYMTNFDDFYIDLTNQPKNHLCYLT